MNTIDTPPAANEDQEDVMLPTLIPFTGTGDDLLQRLDADIARAGGESEPDPELAGAAGWTMFDLPSSEDNTVTVLLSRGHLQAMPSQSLVRIKSRDNRNYIGVVSAGPFAEPDSLRGDSHMLVTVATRGGIYLPPFHGRVQVSILGEEQAEGDLAPPRLRPLPNSGVFVLTDDEAASILRAEGDIRLGLAIGYESLPVQIPSDSKAVLPRHTAVLGTTGGGKSTTIARLIQQAQAAGMAVILLDVEGEYTFLHERTEDNHMLTRLNALELEPRGVPEDQMVVYHLVGRESANPDHPHRRPFSLQFARLSPYTAAEILGLTEPQADRFHKAYEIAKALLRELAIFPKPGSQLQERLAVEIDEFERGYPRLTLSMLMDVVGAIVAKANGSGIKPVNDAFRADDARALKTQIAQLKIDSPVSWRTLLGKLARLNRLKVFDTAASVAKPITYAHLIRPGQVSIVDLSDTSMSELSNVVIADLLRGVQEAQDAAYVAYERACREGVSATPPTRILLIIEEAHEFLSAERVEKMPILFHQVARLAKRGRKRWLGLVFVTQFPQHLPRQVLGLVNSFIIHKITDPQVVSSLQRTTSGVDEGLWRRLPGLAPGQAIVAFPHLAQPLLVAVDPTPAKLRLID
jgi:DNA helicase HerA-like ATPase